jgi:hypothetical protein
MATAFSPSRYSRPSISTRRGSYRPRTSSTAPAEWIAFDPIHDLAVCARAPGTVTEKCIVPWQPASTLPPLGSSSTAKSPASRSGDDLASWPRPFRAASISSQS